MPDITPERRQQIEAHVFAGQKIQAIKLLRESTGCGLADAKQAIDAREAELRQSSPEKFTAPQKSGCMTSIALMVAVAILLACL